MIADGYFREEPGWLETLNPISYNKERWGFFGGEGLGLSWGISLGKNFWKEVG